MLKVKQYISGRPKYPKSPESANEKEELSSLGKKLLSRIKKRLTKLAESKSASCLRGDFPVIYSEVLSLFDSFAAEYLANSGEKPLCSAACGACCNHWAYDVYSFEAEIIGDRLKQAGANVKEICLQIEEDERILGSIASEIKSDGIINGYDMVLLAFYHMERPCELLDSSGSCSIYPMRPMICRSFVNTANPDSCRPGKISCPNSGTSVILLDGDCEDLLDLLHNRYGVNPEDKGLRSQLRRILEQELSK